MLAASKLRSWAADLRNELAALQRALADDRAGWLARLLGFAAIAYALSPVDLIPDFIPVLGLLDDLLIVPLLVYFAIRALPPGLLDEHRRGMHEGNMAADGKTAAARSTGRDLRDNEQGRRLGWAGLAIVMSAWAGIAATAWWALKG